MEKILVLYHTASQFDWFFRRNNLHPKDLIRVNDSEQLLGRSGIGIIYLPGWERGRSQYEYERICMISNSLERRGDLVDITHKYIVE